MQPPHPHLTRPLPITRDLVLLGGGHAHALVLKKWATAPLAGAQVTLVDPNPKAPYTGMLPGYVAGHYQRGDLDIDLVRLARQAGARLILDRAIGIDTKAQRIELQSRPAIAYDTLSIDIGITSALQELPGADKHLIPAKPLGAFADAWSALVAAAQATRTAPTIAVLGAGVAGAELALAMAHRLTSIGLPGQITLIEAGVSILRETNPSARRILRAELARAQINILTEATVTDITDTAVLLKGRDHGLPATFVVSAAGAAPHAWFQETDLDLEDGFVAVDETLASTNTPHVFAAGDCAHLVHAPRPKAGVFAVRQAPVLFDNLRADLSGRALRNFNPQKSYLKLISTGRQSAVTDKWGIGVAGRWVWRLKDHIDQTFMQQFRTRMEMPVPDLPGEHATGLEGVLAAHTHHCSACGAKVDQATLVDGLGASAGASLDDAAIIEQGGTTQVFSTDHLRAFTPDAFMVAKVAAVHALGDIWAMGAAPRAVLAHIILPPLSAEKQALMLKEIMAGAGDIFEACGTRIAGGHTSIGAELTIGFSITGDLHRPAITHGGARPGDALMLTKPIGTGVLLAAEMRQLADGADYQAALDSMCRPQATAAHLLGAHATALTDVTGFGLAGHLFNILEGSGVCAHVELNDVPLLSGALELAEQDIQSTLWPANAAQVARMTMTRSARSDLLFDPQTCGGLLATIPAEHETSIISAFRSAGESIWKIGEISKGDPHISVR